MDRLNAPAVVAVINSNADLVRIVREMLEDEGFSVATIHISQIKQGQESLLQFLADHEPAVVIYDIAPPYSENWRFLQLLQQVPQFAERGLIVTTVNKHAMEAEVGANGAFEIVGTRDNFAPVMSAVNDALKKTATHSMHRRLQENQAGRPRKRAQKPAGRRPTRRKSPRS